MSDDAPTTTTPATSSDTPDAGGALLGGAPATPPAAPATTGDAAPEATTPGDTTPEVAYEFKDVPEGYDTKELEAFAKEHKLAPDVAQKVLARELAASTKVQDAIKSDFENLIKDGGTWAQQIKNDKELGGANFDKSKAVANRAFEKLPEAVRAEITNARLLNSPIFFRFAYEMGKMMEEDSAVRGGQSNASVPIEQRWYGK